jgi:hypothetical protein
MPSVALHVIYSIAVLLGVFVEPSVVRFQSKLDISELVMTKMA